MLFTAVGAVLALASTVLAKPQGYGLPLPAAPSPSTTSSAASLAATGNSAQVFVQVGQSGFNFQPSDIQASVGTLVTFVFPSSIQHSVTESSFDAPCTPLSGGFDSGFAQGGETFSINVTDASTPIYFFCKFPAHCGMGMVGTINAPSSGNTSAAFASAASAIGINEPNVAFTGVSLGGIGAIATAGPTQGTPSVSGGPAPSASGSSSGSSGSSNGAASIAINGGLTLFGAVAAMFAIVL